MPTLAEMAAAQKAKREQALAISGPKAPMQHSAATPTPIPAKAPEVDMDQPTGAATPTAGAGGGFKRKSFGTASAKPVEPAQPISAPVVESKAAPAPAPRLIDTAMDSLEALSNSTEAEAIAIDSGETYATSMLDGETAALAPTRELPEDLTDGMKMFVESLDGLYNVLFDAELFGNFTKNIMVELQDNPEYIKLICDDDVHTMIRGMRDAMGLARIKNVEGKRGTPAAASKAKKSIAAAGEAIDALDSMFDEGDFS